MIRRYSAILGAAVLLMTAFVGYTYRLNLEKRRRAHTDPPPKVRIGDQTEATAWLYNKDDPQTNKPMVRLVAQAVRATQSPSVFELQDLALRLYDKEAGSYTFVKAPRALFDEGSGTLKSDGRVTILMHMPADKDPADKAEADKRVQVETSGVTYETNSGKATTNDPARFHFPDGGGSAVGADYDPNTKTLHLHSQVALDWVGKGPQENKLHIETADLVYKESEQKVYLTPTARLQRQGTTIQAANVVVTLEDGRLHEVDGDAAAGADDRDDRHTTYSADKMKALFNENGTLVNLVGDGNARVVSRQPETETTLTGQHADLRFATKNKNVAGEEKEDSLLHLVMADGHAVAEAVPVPVPGRPAETLADTRILRSEHIELEMRPDGRDLSEIRTSSQAQLEFKPNHAGAPHRVVDASRLRVIYGDGSYVQRFLAWNVQTRTDKPKPAANSQKAVSPSPAITSSDQLAATFQPGSNQVATIEQAGNFHYSEGVRKASATKAFLDQAANRMTLTEHAHVADDAGSTFADEIVMNQSNGDMDANGHVISTHAPNKNQKPGTSMLDDSEPMQAKADHMSTRENNTSVTYQGHAVIWQGGNRILADRIDIDRDDKTLHAVGNVMSELLDNRSEPDASGTPIFTTVFAPELNYSDATRIAHYAGTVKLTRQNMIVTSKEMTAYLTPKTQGSNDSSLDHAVASGDVTIFDKVASNRTRTGTGEHCEYYTRDSKVILSGGSPRMVDSYKGITQGLKLTYFSDDDHVIVDGGSKPIFTEMRKK